MNKLLVRALAAAVFAVLTMGMAASAQLAEGDTIEANIPFRFYANDTWLPAGTYTITLPDTTEPDVLLLQNANDSVEVILAPNSVVPPSGYSNETMLDFDRTGGKDFLSAIWVGNGNRGYQLGEPRLEKQLEKTAMKKHKHSIKAVHHTKS